MTMVAVAPTTASSAPPAGALADVIRSLSRMSDRVEVLNALPPMATRLGFDRAIVSEVVDGCWAPSAVYVPRDRPWADDIREAGRSAPQALGVGMAEDEMLQSRRPVAVRQVRGNPRVHQGIAQVSRSQGYLAAPVAVGDRLGAILHVDRFWTRAPFGIEDAATLQVLGDAAGLVLERAAARATALPPETRSARATQNRATSNLREVLTERELDVAQRIADGLTNAEIAADLVVAEATVKTHVKHILHKLGARHRAEVVSMFLRATP